MFEFQRPFPINQIPMKPEFTGRVKLDETAIQTLAALFGWDGETRRLLTCSLNGSLHTVSPPIKAFKHKKAAAIPVVITCDDIPTTEVVVRGHPDNTGLVYVDINIDPTNATSWPLAANDAITLSINNLNNIRLLMVVGEESVILGYTV